MLDKVERRCESIRREAAEKNSVEIAKGLLDDGIPREVILWRVARNDEAWLRRIEADRKADKPS